MKRITSYKEKDTTQTVTETAGKRKIEQNGQSQSLNDVMRS